MTWESRSARSVGSPRPAILVFFPGVRICRVYDIGESGVREVLVKSSAHIDWHMWFFPCTPRSVTDTMFLPSLPRPP